MESVQKVENLLKSKPKALSVRDLSPSPKSVHSSCMISKASSCIQQISMEISLVFKFAIEKQQGKR